MVPRRGLARSLAVGSSLVASLVILGGCDQSIDPVVGDERPFTIWGYLDAHADTQRVRVFSIESRLGIDRSGPIDAAVISTDLETGEQREWTDAEITFADSSVGHVFWSDFRAEYERSYRLEVRRSDGQTTSAEVTIPPPVEVELVGERDRTVIPALIHGKPPNLVDVSVIYDAITLPPANPWPPGTAPPPPVRLKVAVPYSGEQEPTRDGWRYEIKLRRDFEVVKEEFSINCLRDDLIALRRIDFRFLAADSQWDPPGGSFDPNLLIEPGTFSNVENGLGYFGGGYTVSTRWIPSDVILRTVGYRTSGPCPLSPQNIPDCQLPPEPCLQDGGG